MASALTQSLSKDGQTVPTANMPMGGFKFTGLAAPSGNGESVRWNEFKASFRSLLVGCQLANNSGTPNTKVDMTAGSWADSTNALIFAQTAATIDCTTVGANGLDAGSLATNTWYHAYAIAKADGTVALLASTSVSSPTMPSGYTLLRRIGSFKTDGSSHVKAFTQTGDVFQWTTFITDVSGANLGSVGTPSNQTLSVPTGLAVGWIGRVQGTNDASFSAGLNFGVFLYTPGKTVAVPVTSGGTTGTATATAADGCYVYGMLTNTSAQLTTKGSTEGNNVFVTLETEGWIDRRGKDS